MTRIWYQSAVDFDHTSEYRDALKSRFSQVAQPDTQVDLYGVPNGTWGGHQPSELFGSPIAFHTLLSGPFLRNVLQAERDGYDAFVIGTYIEPFLREARSAVDIPVISSFEAMLLVGCSLGHTLGILTLNRHIQWIIKTNLEKHRLSDRVGPVLVVEPELIESELNNLLSSPDDYLDRFRQMARRAVQEQADVIVPAEGLLAAIVARNGIHEIDGATVMDGIGVPIAFAEMMTRLWKRTGLRTARCRHYARPSDEALAWVSKSLGSASAE